MYKRNYYWKDDAEARTFFTMFNYFFRCKLTTPDNSRGTLVGVSGFIAAVGDDDLACRIYRAAVRSRGDKFTRRLRRGLRITFYAR